MSFTGPVLLVAIPLSPVARQNGVVVDGHALDHRPHRHPLVSCVAHRLAASASSSIRRDQRRRDGDDRPLRRPGLAAPRATSTRLAVALITCTGCLQAHRLAELLREPSAIRCEPADDAALLGAAGGVDQVVEAAGGGGVEERRTAARGRAARPRRPSSNARSTSSRASSVGRVGELPGLERLRVPLDRARGGLRGVARNLGRHRVDVAEQGGELDQGRRLRRAGSCRCRSARVAVAVVDVARRST